jgi:hypothetical protein
MSKKWGAPPPVIDEDLLHLEDPTYKKALEDLSSSEVETKRKAIETLGDYGTTACVPNMIEAVRDPNFRIRIQVIEAIVSIGRDVVPIVDSFIKGGYGGGDGWKNIGWELNVIKWLILGPGSIGA